MINTDKAWMNLGRSLLTQTLKLGTHRKNRRVWLDNESLLTGAGFHASALYDATYYPVSKSIKLKLDDEGQRKVSKKTKGGKDVPVIDLNSSKVGLALGDVKQVKVTYKPGLITILNLREEDE